MTPKLDYFHTDEKKSLRQNKMSYGEEAQITHLLCWVCGPKAV